MTVGILALQGDFQAHQEKLLECGITECRHVRTVKDLENLSGLVLPGGESSTLLKLISPEFEIALISKVKSGVPCLATCAGLILVSSEVLNPQQRSFNLLPVTVERNSYGRQNESFIEPMLKLSESAEKSFSVLPVTNLEGVFIRAPRIVSVSKDTEILLELNGEPVFVKQGNVLGATFHPELSSGETFVHSLFCRAVSDYEKLTN
jgi:pyridoxal 5'-phosphate synthase pdxT subunit